MGMRVADAPHRRLLSFVNQVFHKFLLRVKKSLDFTHVFLYNIFV